MLVKKFSLPCLLAMVLLHVHCGTSKQATPPPPVSTIAFEESRLMATPWRLMAYQQNNVQNRVDTPLEVTLIFEHPKEAPTTTKFYGRAACNRYFGNCTLDQNKLAITNNMGMTRMMCPPAEMDIESKYIKLLPTMTKMAFLEDEKTKKINLVLSNDNNEQLIFFAYHLE